MKFTFFMNENISPEQREDARNNKDIAAFAYTLLFAPLLLVTRRESPFILFHAQQALILFIFSVIFWSLGDSLRYLNIFVLVGCALGFLHAMNEEWYKMPFVYDLSKGGITPSGIWEKVRQGFGFLSRIFSGILPQKGVAHKTAFSESSLSSQTDERVSELERLFCIEKYFRQQSLSVLPEGLLRKMEDILSQVKVIDSKCEEKRTQDLLKLTGTFGIVVIGGYTERSFLIGFSKKSFPQKNPAFYLGDFGIEEVTADRMNAVF